MSFLGTYSALSKNGYQSIGGKLWTNVQTIDTSTLNFINNSSSAPAFNATGEYMAFSLVSNTGLGSVYIYYNGGSGTNWTLQQTITGFNANDFFGSSLSFNDAGDYLAIGAFSETSGQGAAYIYTRSGTTWTQQQRIVASDGQAGDNFGYTISIDGNANYIIVGAPEEDTTPYTANGAAYVFVRSGTTWTQQQKLLAPAGTRGNSDRFGLSLQISQDGLYAIIGAPTSDLGGPSTDNYGIAYVFLRTGTTWANQSSIQRSGPGVINDLFGRNVGINNDGSKIFCRGPGTTGIYIFSRTGTTWTQSNDINYGAYSPIIINNSGPKTTAMQGTANNIIVGLWVNDRTISIDNDGGIYQIQQELFVAPGPNPNDFGSAVGIARTADVCAIESGNSELIYIFVKE